MRLEDDTRCKVQAESERYNCTLQELPLSLATLQFLKLDE